MKKEILVILAAFLILPMTVTPLVLALPWDPKSNTKFQTFSVSLVPNVANIMAAAANPEYIPSEVNPNKAITSWVEEPMIDYTITVGGTTYNLGLDFEYIGVSTFTAIGAPFTPDELGILHGSKTGKFRVDYMYDFSAILGGIEGTLEMLAITTNQGVMRIRSLKGTGDLQNVQIFATGGAAPFTHAGIVSGWPE